MNRHIIDGMKKEGKVWKLLMLFGFTMGVLLPSASYLQKILGLYVNKDPIDKNMFKMALLFLLVGIYGLYGWLYSIKYKLDITEDTIIIRSLFRNTQVNIKDITEYTFERYRKSVFYQFKLFINGKKIVLSTRYKDEFVAILEENQIKQK